MTNEWDDWFRSQGLDPDKLREKQELVFKTGDGNFPLYDFSWYDFLAKCAGGAHQRGLPFTIEGLINYLFTIPKVGLSREAQIGIVPLTFYTTGEKIILFEDENIIPVGEEKAGFGLVHNAYSSTGRRLIRRGGFRKGFSLHSYWGKIDFSDATKRLNRNQEFSTKEINARYYKTSFSSESLRTSIMRHGVIVGATSPRAMNVYHQLANDTQTSIIHADNCGLSQKWEPALQKAINDSKPTMLSEFLAMLCFSIDNGFTASFNDIIANIDMLYNYPKVKVL